MPITMTLEDLYILRRGWAQTLMRLTHEPDMCEDCEGVSVEECLARLGEIQKAVTEVEDQIATVESHERNASKRTN